MDLRKARSLNGLANGLRFHAVYQSRRLRRARRVSVGGVTLLLDVPMMTPEIRTNVLKGFYEKHEQTILDATLSDRDVVLDIGGGIGFIATFCAQRCQVVHTVEANPELIPVIERTLRANGASATVHHGILAADSGTASFTIAPQYWASSANAGTGRTVEVPRLDARALEREVRPTYIVMDIEGGEIDAIPALELGTVEKLCIELHANVVGEPAIEALVADLAQRGFAPDPQLSHKNQKYFQRARG